MCYNVVESAVVINVENSIIVLCTMKSDVLEKL